MNIARALARRNALARELERQLCRLEGFDECLSLLNEDDGVTQHTPREHDPADRPPAAVARTAIAGHSIPAQAGGSVSSGDTEASPAAISETRTDGTPAVALADRAHQDLLETSDCGHSHTRKEIEPASNSRDAEERALGSGTPRDVGAQPAAPPSFPADESAGPDKHQYSNPGGDHVTDLAQGEATPDTSVKSGQPSCSTTAADRPRADTRGSVAQDAATSREYAQFNPVRTAIYRELCRVADAGEITPTVGVLSDLAGVPRSGSTASNTIAWLVRHGMIESIGQPGLPAYRIIATGNCTKAPAPKWPSPAPTAPRSQADLVNESSAVKSVGFAPRMPATLDAIISYLRQSGPASVIRGGSGYYVGNDGPLSPADLVEIANKRRRIAGLSLWGLAT